MPPVYLEEAVFKLNIASPLCACLYKGLSTKKQLSLHEKVKHFESSKLQKAERSSFPFG